MERDPQHLSGAWVFRGTRIPVAALFENLSLQISHSLRYEDWATALRNESSYSSTYDLAGILSVDASANPIHCQIADCGSVYTYRSK
ncbi:DUF433 domain-containing protein [Synechococcus sp. 1G10]|uniref:DUF433 domain-containing protein n=1 Tax=Synechococcus sp. 1G10 TaxID=2025605 RepID=UPI0021007612|nr:DUF433 domain-containing protein [Synechococcus sp. 1G10]